MSIIGVLATMFLPAIAKVVEESRKQSCLNNLRQLGVQVMLYHDSEGRGSYYPTMGFGSNSKQQGADFTVSLYDASSMDRNNPNLYICPSQSSVESAFSAMGANVMTNYAGWSESAGFPIDKERSENGIIADWDESRQSNHAGGVNILFADGHARFHPWGFLHNVDGNLITDSTLRNFQWTDFNHPPDLVSREMRSLVVTSNGDPAITTLIPAPSGSRTLTSIVLDKDDDQK